MICPKCEVDKPFSRFPLRDGRTKIRRCCSACYLIIGNRNRRERYRLHPEKHDEAKKRLRQRQKEIRWGRKVAALTNYGGTPPKCACCGEGHIEFLNIDHKNGDGQKHRKMFNNDSTTFFRWLEKQNYPKDLGLRVLCWNCNCSMGTWGYCPHDKVKVNHAGRTNR